MYISAMYSRSLYRTAFISLPILAFFELAPIYMLSTESHTHQLVYAFVIALFGIGVTWIENILIIYYFDKKGIHKKWLETLLSFAVMIFQITLTLLYLKTLGRGLYVLIFYGTNALALNAAILLLANSVISQKKREKLNAEISLLKIKNLEAEQEQLMQQLQPHFLFNALSTLKSLISTNTELAEEYLIKLSDFLRFSVSSNKRMVVSLAEELNFTKDYIDLQQIRFDQSFDCRIDIPDSITSSYLIPIYGLQSLVENAIKHNAFTSENPLLVQIRHKEGYLNISNNMIPKTNMHSSGFGLSNLSNRYKLLCGEDLRIENTGETFTVIIKLIEKD